MERGHGKPLRGSEFRVTTLKYAHDLSGSKGFAHDLHPELHARGADCSRADAPSSNNNNSKRRRTTDKIGATTRGPPWI